MSDPPLSYRSVSSEEHLAAVTKNLTVEEKKDLATSSASSSMYSGKTAHDNGIFTPSKTLIVNAAGMSALGCGMSSSQLEITITTPDGARAYTSTRGKRRSGNAVLSAPGRGDLVASFYRWGPGRPPTLQLLNAGSGSIADTAKDSQAGGDTVATSGKWTSRTISFKASATTGAFEWLYVSERPRARSSSSDKKSKKQRRLVLEIPSATEKGQSVRLAQLLRDTGSMWKCTAGKGGELQIDSAAAKAADVSEEIIVATCIMMLKKEMDRQRESQIAVLGAAASGS